VGCYDDGEGYLQMVFLDDDEIPLVQGMMNRNNPLDFKLEYTRQQVTAALSVDPMPSRVLVLGLGVGAIPRTLRALYPELTVDVVEIEMKVIKAAVSYFKLRDDPERFRLYNADAVEFVKRNESKGAYDVVFMDAYNAQGIPEVLRTREFYDDMLSCVRPNGLLSINLINDTQGADTVLDYAQDYLVDPLLIRTQESENMAIFGVKKDSLTETISTSRILERMKERAVAVDRRMMLPYALGPQVSRTERLDAVRERNFDWTLPP